jgi:hypothetical protein
VEHGRDGGRHRRERARPDDLQVVVDDVHAALPQAPDDVLHVGVRDAHHLVVGPRDVLEHRRGQRLDELIGLERGARGRAQDHAGAAGAQLGTRVATTFSIPP